MDDIEIVQLDDYGKQRIAVMCLPGLESFLPVIVDHLSKTYSVKTCYSRDMNEITKAIDWCDIVFLEWMNEMAISTTNQIPAMTEKKVIIRCHSYEVFLNYAQQIRWSNVDVLLFVCNHIKSIVLKQIPKLPEMVDIHIVPNGV